MTKIRRINVSLVEGSDANNIDAGEIRPFGEASLYINDAGPIDKLELLISDGVRTNLRNKVLSKGIFYGGDADSSDGLNRDTIKLIPDAGLHYYNNNTDQYLIIDPTEGDPIGHIHIRAGGAIDNSNADLFLGGEKNNVRVSDTNDSVTINTDAGEGTRIWIFDNSGNLTFPDGTETSGQGIWPPVDNGLGITLTRNVELSAVAAVNSGEGQLYIDISENDDIIVVDMFWKLNTGTLTAPVLTSVTGAMTTEPGVRRISVSGVTFVPGETYTFRRDSIDAVDWVFLPSGDLRTSGLGTISHYPGSTSSLKFEVPAGNNIVLRTAGGDWQFGSDGNVTVPGNITKTSGNLEITAENYVIIDSTNGGQIDIGANQSGEGSGDSGPILIGHAGNILDIAAGKLRINSTIPPTTSTGAVGDVAGLVAFSSGYLYYCTADYGQVGHQVTIATAYNGATSLNTNAFQLTKTADTLQITVGDVISDSDGGATSTVVTVSSDENYTYVGTGGLAYSAVFPLTFTSTDPAYVSGGNIWKRVAWSGDTW